MTDKTGSVELDAAMRKVRELADDWIYGHLFELPYHDCSQLFFGSEERLVEVAHLLSPTLGETGNVARTIEAACRTPKDDDQVFALLVATRKAFFNIGVLLGARLSDPSGQAFERLAAGWKRTRLGRSGGRIKTNVDDD